MIRHFNSTRWFVVICLLLVVSSFLPTRLAGAISAMPHSVLSMVLAPITYQLRSVSLRIRPAPAENLIDDEQRDWRRQFFEQKQYTLRLAEQLDILNRQLLAFERIAEVVGDQPVEFLHARVTAAMPSGGKALLMIDRGESAGVQTGDAVVVGEYLIGRIEQVGMATANVQLITTVDTSLKVRILPPNVGFGQEATPEWIRRDNDGDGFIRQVPANASPRIGDLAHLSDERWPAAAQGFVVGQVTEVVPDPSNPKLFSIVRIVPLPAFESLHEVTVLTEASP